MNLVLMMDQEALGLGIGDFAGGGGGVAGKSVGVYGGVHRCLKNFCSRQAGWSDGGAVSED